MVSSLFAVEPQGDEARLQFLYDRLAESFSFGAARVRLSARKLTGGEIRYGQPHRITVSAHLSPRDREDTLRHEAAHAWAFRLKGRRVGHGPLFRRLAAQLGASGGRAPVTAALSEFRRQREVLYRCEGCGRDFCRVRPFKRRTDCLACWRAKRPSRLTRVQRS
jgi:predicted SprT family Zn-dependent metalloprotease